MVKVSLLSNPVKNLCAIDASTNSLAFAIFTDKELVASGKIKFSGIDTYVKVGDAARKSFAFLKNFEY